MRFSAIALSTLVVSVAEAFVSPRPSFRTLKSLASTTEDEVDASPEMMDMDLAKEEAKESLIETAKSLKTEYGVLVIEKAAKDELKAAVEKLENLSEPPAIEEYSELFLGDWTLVSTTAVNNDGVDTSKLPAFFGQDPLKKIRQSIREAANKYLVVQQKVKDTKEDGVIDRIDNTLEYQPPSELKELLDAVPAQLSQLNINPLHVSKSKLVLVHKATVESEMPLKTKIALQSIVLNVAGESTFLEPSGSDIAGLNLPLGEFINTGTFETTYMDETLRISRGKQGFVDQLRVFIKTDRLKIQEALEEIVTKSTEPITDADIEEDEFDTEIVDIGMEEDEHAGADDVSPSDVGPSD